MFLTAFKSVVLVSVLVGGWILYSQSILQQEVLFLSLESKTPHGDNVYNSIKLFPGTKKDIWMMNQSHYGLNAVKQSWDRLAIIVDKSTSPKTAVFLQLPPGELQWSEDLLKKKIENKISCFICHSNGPRAIRPNTNEFTLGLLKQWQIALWNYRIKNYGKVQEPAEQAELDSQSTVPFRHRSNFDNEKLQVKACLKCHNDNSDSGRGFLTRQNAVAINFMIENKIMPPGGKHISESDLVKIQNFTLGL